MADQRFRNLESGGSVRITEAVMRGSGPQGPKGDRGPSGPATVIKGRKTLSTIVGMIGEGGDAYIIDEPDNKEIDGHLLVWDPVGFEANMPGVYGFWLDVGKIVGPAADTQSLGAQLSTETPQYVAGGMTVETAVIFTTIDYNDTEDITNSSGTEYHKVPVIDVTITPTDYWSYGDRRVAESAFLGDPLHLFQFDMVFTALANQTVEGPITVALYKKTAGADNWVPMGVSASEYFETNNKPNPTQTVSMTYLGKTDPTDLYQLRVLSAIAGNLTKARLQTGRVGGVTGPKGPEGPRGEQGPAGPQGIAGMPGQGSIPTGMILPFAGHELDIQGNYKVDNLGNPVLNSNGDRIPEAEPMWLLCDGRAVPQNSRLYKEMGMKNTPNLVGKSLIGFNQDQWDKIERPKDGSDVTNWNKAPYDNEYNTEWYRGSNTLNANQVPTHTHDFDKAYISALKLKGMLDWVDFSHVHSGNVAENGGHSHYFYHGHKGYQNFNMPNNRYFKEPKNAYAKDNNSNKSGHLSLTTVEFGVGGPGWYSNPGVWSDMFYTGSSGNHGHSFDTGWPGWGHQNIHNGHIQNPDQFSNAVQFNHTHAIDQTGALAYKAGTNTVSGKTKTQRTDQKVQEHQHPHVLIAYVIKT